MDAQSTNISLANLPTELQDEIYHDVYASSPSRSITPKIHASSNSDHKTGISLLVLPTEIRYQIYRDVFHERYILPSFTDLTFPYRTPSYADYCIANTSLLQTCKDLREDALEFVYATITFRVLFPLRAQESLLGPSQSIIDRMKHVELNIDMTYCDSFEAFPPWWAADLDSELMDIFYSTMLCKLSARKTPGVACRIIFRHCSLDQLPWGELPFFEALKRVPKYRMVTMELRYRSARFCPYADLPNAHEMNLLYESLKNVLSRSLQTKMRLRQGQDNGSYRCLELHPRGDVAKENVADMVLAREDSEDDEAGEEDPGDENTSEEDSVEDAFDEDDSDGEDCFQD